MILAAFVGERAAAWAARNWKAIAKWIAPVLAIIFVAIWIGTLKHRIDGLKVEVAQRDTAMAKHLKLDADAAAAVARERAITVLALAQAQIAAEDAQRAAAAATEATATERKRRLAAAVARDPKGDTPVGAVLGSIFDEEKR